MKAGKKPSALTGSGSCEKKGCREKYWSELTESEKIERMRREVHYLQNILNTFSSEMHALRSHRHDGQDVMIPFERNQNTGSGAGNLLVRGRTEIDDVFF